MITTHRTQLPGLVEDLDDDNDGIPDSEEVGGLDSTNPDTDGTEL